MRSIAVASGKGGVGKTTVALNLALALAQAGRKAVVVDADVVMSNLGILLGVERTPLTLHNVLMGEVGARDAVYDGPGGLKYVPAGLSIEKLKRLNYSRLKQAVADLSEVFDYVIVDCPPGLGVEAESALKSCKEALLVVTPDPAALADCLKVKNLVDRAGLSITGVVYNMATGDRSEISKQDMETVMGAAVVAELPFDPNVRRANASQSPVLLKFPATQFSKALLVLAARVSGEPVPEVRVKRGFLQELMDGLRRLFKHSR